MVKIRMAAILVVLTSGSLVATVCATPSPDAAIAPPVPHPANEQSVSTCEIRMHPRNYLGRNIRLRAIMHSSGDRGAIFTNSECKNSGIYDITDYSKAKFSVRRFRIHSAPDLITSLGGKYEVDLEGTIKEFESEPRAMSPWEPRDKIGFSITRVIEYKEIRN